MTLAEALRVLHEAGRIRSPWLPGMLIRRNGSDDRVSWFDGEYLHASTAYGKTPPRGTWIRIRPASLNEYEPVASDPCTSGALLALLREATGDPTAHVTGRVLLGAPLWVVVSSKPLHRGLPASGDTEGAALSAALIAVAREPSP